MKLTYKVLWFEDHPEDISATIDGITEIVEDHGFKFESELLEKASEESINLLTTKLTNYNPYDLIIFDYDLGSDSETGLNIAKHLRSSIYTDLIFYSGRGPSELRKMLYENQIDGVFIIDRANFVDEAEGIIDDHIKRMSDINNIRGVVMSAMSDIDIRMRSLIPKLITSESNADKVLEDLKRRLTDRYTRNAKIIDRHSCGVKLSSDPILTDFQQIRLLLHYLINFETAESNNLFEENGLIKDLQSERNLLAHQKEHYIDAENKMTISNHKGEVIEYGFNEFVELRKKLISISNKLQEIETSLES